MDRKVLTPYFYAMDFQTESFHDATILSVTEDPATQTIDFLIDYPEDWRNNLFEHRILQFIDVTHYLINELLKVGHPTILDIRYKPISTNSDINHSEISVIIDTNAGYREITYKEALLLQVR